MRIYLTLFIAFFAINITSAQFYITPSVGYAIGSAEQKLGEVISPSATLNSYGSYGEGLNVQLRAGYFFNDTFGIDIGFSYLHGANQTVMGVHVPGLEAEAVARARAFGFSPSVVYKFTDHLYGRFGALLKLGGKTEAVASKMQVFTDDEAAMLGLPSGSYSQTNYTEDYHGKLPLGFVGAFGYKHSIGGNFDLFVEAEYMGISVKRKDSEITAFNTDILLPDGTIAVPDYYSLDNLPDGYTRTSEFVDEIPNNNTDPSVKLGQSVPYSSFGLNIGVTYTFATK